MCSRCKGSTSLPVWRSLAVKTVSDVCRIVYQVLLQAAEAVRPRQQGFNATRFRLLADALCCRLDGRQRWASARMTDPRFDYKHSNSYHTLRVYSSIKSRIQVHISPFQPKYRYRCATVPSIRS